MAHRGQDSARVLSGERRCDMATREGGADTLFRSTPPPLVSQGHAATAIRVDDALSVLRRLSRHHCGTAVDPEGSDCRSNWHRFPPLATAKRRRASLPV